MAHDVERHNEVMKEALEESIRRGEVGIQVAGYVDGELAFNVGAGIADKSTRQAVDVETLFCPFSVTKAITAAALHSQAAKGRLEYSDTVASHWPEFGQHGKGSITIRDLLSHRAGIPWMPEGITPETQADWDWMIKQIEGMEPSYPTNTVNAYHALIWGWIVGELVHRVDPEGRSFEQVEREDVLGPLGIEDLFFGVPASEFHRVARLYGGNPPDGASEIFMKGMPAQVYPGARAYNEPLAVGSVNPGAGSFGTAESYARVFGLLANHGELGGFRLFTPEQVDRFLEPRQDSEEVDIYLGAPSWVGAYGYHLAGHGATAHALLGASDYILHHPGAGNSIGWAETDTGLAVAICHNGMHSGPPADMDKHPYRPIVDAARQIRDDIRASQMASADG